MPPQGNDVLVRGLGVVLACRAQKEQVQVEFGYIVRSKRLANCLVPGACPPVRRGDARCFVRRFLRAQRIERQDEGRGADRVAFDTPRLSEPGVLPDERQTP